jgi:hypothetical protein
MATTDTNLDLTNLPKTRAKGALDALYTFNPVKTEFSLRNIQKKKSFCTSQEKTLRLRYKYQPVNAV